MPRELMLHDRLTSEKAKLELMVKYNLTDSEFALFTGNR